MTGGRLYAHTLEAIIRGFAVSAPVERSAREEVSFLTEKAPLPSIFTASNQMFRNTHLIPCA